MLAHVKRFIPVWIKDGLKSVVAAASGQKLVPRDAVVVPADWHNFERDGLMTKHEPPYLEDQAFLSSVEWLRKNQAFGSTPAENSTTNIYRLYVVYKLVQTCLKVPGDLVEFGTFRGATAYLMLAASQSHANVRIYLYDTFSGIPNENLTDREHTSGLAGRYAETSAAGVLRMLGEFANRVELRQGQIPATLDDTGPEAISLMHVDLNLSAPTLQALEWAFPRWSVGGICVLDDYLWAGYEDQKQVVDEFFRNKGLPIVGLPTGQGIVIRPGTART